MARYFLNFTRDESCGKCNYCRIGTKRMLEILERNHQRTGTGRRYREAGRTGRQDQGRFTVRTWDRLPPTRYLQLTLRYFRNEYEDHIYNHKCTAGSCKALYSLPLQTLVRGCTACARKCPVGAISGSVKENMSLTKTKCIKCGKCLETCKFGAIEKGNREEDNNEQVQT